MSSQERMAASDNDISPKMFSASSKPQIGSSWCTNYWEGGLAVRSEYFIYTFEENMSFATKFLPNYQPAVISHSF